MILSVSTTSVSMYYEKWMVRKMKWHSSKSVGIP